MLKAIRKLMGQDAPQEKNMEDTPIVAEAVVDNTSELQTLQAQVMEAAQKTEALMAQLAAAEAALATIAAEKAEFLAQVHKVKMDARRAVVEMNIGTAKADAFMLATEALDDVAFAAVASALAGSVEQESNTPLFKEVGVDAKTEAEALAGTKSREMEILKAQYKQDTAN